MKKLNFSSVLSSSEGKKVEASEMGWGNTNYTVNSKKKDKK